MTQPLDRCRVAFAFLLFFGAGTLKLGASDVTTGDRVSFKESIKEVPAGVRAARPYRIRENLTAGELAESLDFVVSLRMRNYDELEMRIHSRQFVPANEIEANYLPNRYDYERVRRWLRDQGFTLTLNDPNHVNAFARGTVAQISAALGATFARVSSNDGEFTSAVTAPSLPREISGCV